jgi:hypothetical protein
LNPIDISRLRGIAAANEDDATLWRWFSLMFEDSRIRWCFARDRWLVSVDHRHVATEASFDEAIRAARDRFDADWESADGSFARNRTRRRPARSSHQGPFLKVKEE